MSAYKRVQGSVIRKKLAEKDGNMCNMCGMFFSENIVSTIDHIVPQVKGGHNGWHNLQLLCAHCNHEVKKGHSPIGIFLAQKGKKIMTSAPKGTDMQLLWESTKKYFVL